MKVVDYFPPNWWSAEGIRKKRAMIEAKGIPCLKNWRFITLTLDPNLFVDEVEGYRAGTDHMRRFIDAVRREFAGEFQVSDDNPEGRLKQGNKLEFHSEGSQNEGWPHWHMVLNLTRKLTVSEMQRISGFWGFGRVNFRRCEGPTLDYVFKYIFKCPEASLRVPDWFADYYAEGKTFSRVRFWKTSKGFYTGRAEAQKPKAEQKTCIVPETVREKFDRWSRSGVLTAFNDRGEYVVSRVTEFSASKRAVFGRLGVLVMLGRATCEYDQQYKTGRENIVEFIPPWQTKTNPAVQLDRQTITREVRFRNSSNPSSASSGIVRDYILRVS